MTKVSLREDKIASSPTLKVLYNHNILGLKVAYTIDWEISAEFY